MDENSSKEDWLGDARTDRVPNTWGKWGDDDELGALNYLTGDEVLRGITAVEEGIVFALGLPINHERGDPIWPGRHDADHHMIRDHGHYESGKVSSEENRRASDDVLYMFTHGSTHFDALGHVWYGDRLYNGFDPASTMGGLDHLGIENVAEHGIVGHGVLLDVARYRDVDRLDPNSRITLDELEECADAQGTTLERRDVINVRTGATELWYEEGPDAFMDEYFTEDRVEPTPRLPGITYSEDMIEWFAEMELPAFCTDTMGFEQTISDVTGTLHPLHRPLLRDLGVLINELSKLDELAEHCADDGTYEFLYVASPLKLHGGAGGTVNPLAIK